MNCLKGFVAGAVRRPSFQTLKVSVRTFRRKPSSCDVCLHPPEKKPCFDIRSVVIERGNQCHTRMIRSFLYTHFWPREPSVASLWMSLDSQYLDVLTEKYSNSGDRFLAFELVARTGERKLIGVIVANKVYPWMSDELEDWAHYTYCPPERNRMYFYAHCYRNPNFFTKYHVPYVYDVEVLATAAEVTGQGVGTMLLRKLLEDAQELRHPLVQVIAVSQYAAKICKKCGMKRDWTMDYSDFVDNKGQRVFFPRRPHQTVSIFTRYLDPKLVPEPPCKPQFFQ